MKKYISILLSLCMVLSVLSVGFVSTFAEEGIQTTTETGGEAEGEEGGTEEPTPDPNPDPEPEVDPDDEKEWNRIDETNAYWYFNAETKTLKFKVIAPDTEEYEIEGEAVKVTATIPDFDSETVAPWAECDYTSIVFKDGIVGIGNRAFAGSNVEAVEIPEAIATIGYGAFSDCKKLTTVTVNSALDIIKGETFKNCVCLKTVTLPNSVKSIGEEAFYNCSALEAFTVPADVTSIGKNAFAECTKLATVTFNDSLEAIGDYAFYKCTALTAINVTSKVKSIGEYAFWGCSLLASVSFGEALETIGKYAFYRCTALEDIEIPDSVTEIGDYVFTKCSALKSVKLGNTLKAVSKYAFYSCTALNELTLGRGLETINSNAFDGCSALEAVVMPENVTAIESNAFSGCSKLASVTFPDGLKTIGDKAFNICPELKSVTLGKKVESIGTMGLGYGKRSAVVDGFTISGHFKTDAQRYAEANNMTYVELTPMSGKLGENVEWSYNDEAATLTVSGTGATFDYTIDSLPEFTEYNFTIKNIVVDEGVTNIGSYALVLENDIENIRFGKSIEILSTENPFGFKRVVKTAEDEATLFDVEKCANLTVKGYDETPVKEYSELNELKYQSLSVFALKLAESAKATVDLENNMIFLYQTQMTKDALTEILPQETFESIELSSEPIATGTTLTVSAYGESRTYKLIVPGDVSSDGNVNSADALAMLQHSVEAKTLEGDALLAGDLRKDGVINSADALVALQISVGSIELDSMMKTEE